MGQKRWECRPGRPLRASTSKPESSPKAINPLACENAAAFLEAFSAYVRPSSGTSSVRPRSAGVSRVRPVLPKRAFISATFPLLLVASSNFCMVVPDMAIGYYGFVSTPSRHTRGRAAHHLATPFPKLGWQTCFRYFPALWQCCEGSHLVGLAEPGYLWTSDWIPAV